MVILTRVDHRLIHGQVAFSWTNTIKANCILVVSDKVVADPIQISTMKLAAPQGVKVVIKSLEDSIKSLNSGVTDKYKLFIVVGDISTAYELIKKCPEIKELNLGGTLDTPEASQITPAVFLTESDIEKIKTLISEDVTVYSQIVPTEQKVMVNKKL